MVRSAQRGGGLIGGPLRHEPIRPYVYVCDLDATVEAAAERGASIITAPYSEGNLRIAVITDPAGNVVGIWTG